MTWNYAIIKTVKYLLRKNLSLDYKKIVAELLDSFNAKGLKFVIDDSLFQESYL